jgi:curli production assembly/transport component CsgG
MKASIVLGPLLGILVLLNGCAVQRPQVAPSNVGEDAVLTPTTGITRDLNRLPAPRAKVAAAVFGFRDQTGQLKPAADSPYSYMVTQGAGSLLIKALGDSGWFLPVEREGLQNLLTERRIARALEEKPGVASTYPALIPATVIFEGGIVAFETNVRTGGAAANFLGIGSGTKYRVDQVTVSLRAVDVRTGQISNSVLVTKTVSSYEITSQVYRFTSYQHLLQAETGITRNEPSQLAVKEAIESAVIHLIVQGVRDRTWSLKDDADWKSPIVQRYLKEDIVNLGRATADELSNEPLPMPAPSSPGTAPEMGEGRSRPLSEIRPYSRPNGTIPTAVTPGNGTPGNGTPGNGTPEASAPKTPSQVNAPRAAPEASVPRSAPVSARPQPTEQLDKSVAIPSPPPPPPPLSMLERPESAQ